MRSLLLLSVALTAAECERTPPDDSARTTVAPVSAAVDAPPAVAAQARCVELTPHVPPPPVAPGPAPGCPQDPEGRPPLAQRRRVSFSDVSGVAVNAELARSEDEAMRGLMYRTAMGEDSGMLFDLQSRANHKFWMHNTCIPLDMIFIDEDGLIVGIVENAPALDDRTRGVGCPSRWVLEVNAGWSRRHGVRAGQRAEFER